MAACLDIKLDEIPATFKFVLTRYHKELSVLV